MIDSYYLSAYSTRAEFLDLARGEHKPLGVSQPPAESQTAQQTALFSGRSKTLLAVQLIGKTIWPWIFSILIPVKLLTMHRLSDVGSPRPTIVVDAAGVGILT